MKIEKCILSVMVGGCLLVGVTAYNAAMSTSEPVGEPHVVSSSYCAEPHYGAKTYWCGRYGTAYEKHQDIVNHGPLWDFEGYKIVR